MAVNRIHILMVGVPMCDVQMHLVGLNMAIREHHDFKVSYIIDTSFEDAAVRVSTLSELDIVSVSNKVGLSRMRLAEGCLALATELAMCGGNPWVHLPDPHTYFAGTMFRNLGIRATEKSILELILERCTHRKHPLLIEGTRA